MTLKHLNQTSIAKLTATREGEQKVGEAIKTLSKNEFENLSSVKEQYILLGISEDIGVRANHGNPGTKNAWNVFLKAFVNVQNNGFLPLSKCAILGEVVPSELLQQAEHLNPSKPADLTTLRALTKQVDELVFSIIYPILKAGKTPLVIGGGHNNSFPLLKAASITKNTTLNAINCDPHSDFRQLEGRHSGNGFSYAHHHGYLKNYAIVGLHEGYNSASNISALQKAKASYFLFEDVFVRKTSTWKNQINQAISTLDKSLPTGLELDLDSIAKMPVSAYSPSGLRIEQARQYVHLITRTFQPVYVHFCEGVPSENPQSEIEVGKTLSYLVQDVLKAF